MLDALLLDPSDLLANEGSGALYRVQSVRWITPPSRVRAVSRRSAAHFSFGLNLRMPSRTDVDLSAYVGDEAEHD
jgi:hypothetical protein